MDLLTSGANAFQCGRFDEAALAFEAAASARPNDFRPLNNLGEALRKLERFSDAEDVLRRAIDLSDRRHPTPALSLGRLYEQVGRLADAAQVLELALALQPENYEIGALLGETYLGLGRYAEGWALYENRLGGRRSDEVAPPPTWARNDLDGRAVALTPEQGLGDQIMFSRFAAPLVERGGEVELLLSGGLGEIFRASGHRAAHQTKSGFELTGPLDLVGRLLSLPHYLGTTLDALPPPLRLRVEPVATGARIGIAPTGNPKHSNDRHRSLPTEAITELLNVRGAVDLRPHDGRSFLETARLIAGLELVVSVDTSVAHLAASMGKPTWVLLPAIGTDWRWMQDRDDTPWYPTARLLRQRTPGDWGEVLASVRAALN